jgi:signal transduction histidine kinase/ActR/RegA family two-component response regulator
MADTAASARVRSWPLACLLRLMVGIGLLPLALLGAWAVWGVAQDARRELERLSLDLSRAQASAVAAELDATIAALESFGRSPLLAQGDLRALHAQLRTEVEGRPGWLVIHLADAQGRLLFRTSRPYGDAGGPLATPQELDAVLRSGQPAVGRLAAGPGGQQAFPVRVPLFDEGRLTHVITVAVKPERIAELLVRQQGAPGAVISVFDNQLRRVARSEDHAALLGGAPAADLQVLFDAKRGTHGSGVTGTASGRSVFTGFTRLPGHDWTVAVGIPTASADAAFWRSVGWTTAGVVVSALLCLAMAARLQRRVLGGVAALRDGALALSDGRQPPAAPATGIVELDQLAQAIDAASQRLLRSAQSLREALGSANAAGAAKDEFLAVLGHELRNPLAPMVTALHLMELKGEGATARERAILQRQVDQLRRLVDDLLDVSRIASGKLHIERRPVNLFTAVERAVEALQPAAEQHGRGIYVQLPAEPVWVSGDEARLVQALSNLLGNAVRFGAQAGPVSIGVVRAGAGQVRIAVRDEGLGMTPQTLARVFEAFYQAPQRASRQAGGLGLGLAIVKSVVELHGGSVSAGSEGPGRGSTFEITLPTIAAPHPPAPAAPPETPSHTGRVLVVDDHGDALQTLCDALRVAGHRVQATASARDALAAVQAGEMPDVAILDIGLPGMDGYELATRLRAHAGWHGALVALTGYGLESDKAKARAAGFALHFTKPVDPAELLNALEALLARQAARPAGDAAAR